MPVTGVGASGDVTFVGDNKQPVVQDKDVTAYDFGSDGAVNGEGDKFVASEVVSPIDGKSLKQLTAKENLEAVQGEKKQKVTVWIEKIEEEITFYSVSSKNTTEVLVALEEGLIMVDNKTEMIKVCPELKALEGLLFISKEDAELLKEAAELLNKAGE